MRSVHGLPLQLCFEKEQEILLTYKRSFILKYMCKHSFQKHLTQPHSSALFFSTHVPLCPLYSLMALIDVQRQLQDIKSQISQAAHKLPVDTLDSISNSLSNVQGYTKEYKAVANEAEQIW